YFTGRSKGFMAYPRSPLSLNCIKDNLSLLSIRNNRKGKTNNFFIANKIVDKDGVSPLDNCKFFPLYLYPESNGQQSIDQIEERTPNLNTKIVDQIAENLGLSYTNEKETTENSFAPIDILEYIYAVLHSLIYREKYKEFLKIDFPRVPYPEDKDTFWSLVKLGREIRQIHLLESPKVEKYITSYPKDGNNTITTKIGKKDWEFFDEEKQLGRIWINEEQYFDNIPLKAWEFYIGGYQPAQKWLKDRKGRTLSFEDILHYQKIIVALNETDRLMKEIDKIEIK
ncbi:MAG: type ISP restriction/modification enzyme, partial [Bacteroidota bacterium]